MVTTWYDDQDSAVALSTSWTVYNGSAGGVDATAWYGSTFSSCSATSSTSRSAGCNATFVFDGPGTVYAIGDFNPNQRGFYCVLTDGQDTLQWSWLNGSTLAGVTGGSAGLNRTRCSVSGLQSRVYSLTFGQFADEINDNGVTIDAFVFDNSTATADTLTWSSDFVAASGPEAGYEWTTALPTSGSVSSTTVAPSSTSTSTTASSTSTSTGGGSNSTAIGVGVGVGVGCAVGLALVAAWFFWRRRRTGSEGTVATEPHHAMGERSVVGGGSAVGGGSENGGVVPYQSPYQAPPPTEYGRQSQFSGSALPEVQDVQPYHSASTARNSTATALDNPNSFRVRLPPLLSLLPANSPSPGPFSLALLPLMALSYVDDTDAAFSYTQAWYTYRGTSGAIDATPWFDETFHSVDITNNPDETIARADFSFTGSGAVLYGDYNPDQSRFWCNVDGGIYHWYNAGSAPGITKNSLNVTRCAVTGLEVGRHTLSFGQTAEDAGANGATIDFAVVDPSARTVEEKWASAFDSMSPPDGMADTTRVSTTSALSTSTLSSSTSSSSASSPSASREFSSLSSTTSSFANSSSSSSFTTSIRAVSTASSTSAFRGTSTFTGSGQAVSVASPTLDTSEKNSSSSGGGGINEVGVGVGAGVGGAALLLAVGFLWYRARKNRGNTDYATSYAASQAGELQMRSPSTARAGNVNSLYSTTTTTPNPFDQPGFVVPTAFNEYHNCPLQRAPSATFPEIQDDGPSLPYLRGPSVEPHEVLSPAGGPVPHPSVPPSLDAPYTFRPRY
ncbi:hypothetical protein JCM8547_001767 [Rhodosporidiobolus lusitaniae]